MPATHKMVVLNTASAICHVKLGAIAKKCGVMYAVHTQLTIKRSTPNNHQENRVLDEW